MAGDYRALRKRVPCGRWYGRSPFILAVNDDGEVFGVRMLGREESYEPPHRNEKVCGFVDNSPAANRGACRG